MIVYPVFKVVYVNIVKWLLERFFLSVGRVYVLYDEKKITVGFQN